LRVEGAGSRVQGVCFEGSLRGSAASLGACPCVAGVGFMVDVLQVRDKGAWIWV